MGIIKTPSEIKLLKKSAKITNSCIPIIEKALQEDVTETELRKRIERNIRKHGASLAFDTIVVSGTRSALMHTFNDTGRVIRGIGYADFGASYKGYKTDITVPFIKGKIGKVERKIVDTEMKAYKLAVKSLKLGEPCWKLFRRIYDFQKKEGFKLKHRLGHGLGKKIHEYPFLVIPGMESIKRAGKERKMFDWEVIRNHCFQKGMVFTIEPGVYVNGVGGCRLENDFLMTSKGAVQLTHSKLIEI